MCKQVRIISFQARSNTDSQTRRVYILLTATQKRKTESKLSETELCEVGGWGWREQVVSRDQLLFITTPVPMPRTTSPEAQTVPQGCRRPWEGSWWGRTVPSFPRGVHGSHVVPRPYQGTQGVQGKGQWQRGPSRSPQSTGKVLVGALCTREDPRPCIYLSSYLKCCCCRSWLDENRFNENSKKQQRVLAK